MSTRQKWLWIGGGLAAVLLLCGLVAGAALLGRWMFAPVAPAADTDAQVATWAAATLQALLSPTPPAPGAEGPSATTPAASPPPAGGSPAASPTPMPTIASPTPAPTATPVPTATPPCLAARFVKDVTVPDGTTFAPGETFTKTWRLRNVGACTWTTAFEVYFDHGDHMNGPTDVNLPHAVDPGETVDVSVELTAPADEGTYKGYWKLRSDEGKGFGIGADRNTAFWVEIKVVAPTLPPPPPPIYNLYAAAPSAQWVSGAGVLPFDGPDNDDRGFVKPQPGKLLEDGTTSSQILETHPQWVNDGAISGLYPPITVVDGYHFQARIGFLALGDGSCGAGDAIFQVNYKDESDTLHPLGQWHETCDGNLRFIDIDLSPLAGQSIRLVLAVMANGSPAQDWAVWVEPQVRVP